VQQVQQLGAHRVTRWRRHGEERQQNGGSRSARHTGGGPRAGEFSVERPQAAQAARPARRRPAAGTAACSKQLTRIQVRVLDRCAQEWIFNNEKREKFIQEILMKERT
jgi:hypothetical protein